MAKIKRILVFITAVMMLFALSIGFAGCKDEEEEKITYMIYVSDRQLTGLTNVTDAAIMEGVQLVCELKDGDDKEVTISYVEGSYIYVRYMMPNDDYTLFTCGSSATRYYSVDYKTPEGQWIEKDSDGRFISVAPQILRRGTFIYRCKDSTYDIPLENYYARHYYAKLTLIVE